MNNVKAEKNTPSGNILPPGYTMIKKLGQGGYGSVYLCREATTNRELAVKQLQADDKGIPEIMEANIMACISHPHLVHTEKIILSTDHKYLWLFQEPAKCDLAYLTRKKDQLPQPHLLKQWAFSLVQAIACLHQEKIVHGDIKASNILLFEGDIIRLTDFNLSHKIWNDGDLLNYRSCTCTHRPLEVWLGQEWDFAVDIWSLGCTLFEIAYGTYLFPYQGWEDNVPKWLLKERFISCLDDFAKKGPSGLQVVPYTYNRSNAAYLSFHIPSLFYNPEYAVFNSLLLSMLRFDPKERPKIATILKHPYFQGMTPNSYDTVVSTTEAISPKKEEKYRAYLKKYTTNAIVTTITLNIIKKIQHLHFRYPNFEDDKLRLLGAYWIANKLVTRRHPSLPYPLPILHRLERRICEYLSYCLIM